MEKSDEQVFISYAREDFDVAQKLFLDLKKNGIKTWWDHDSLLPGENWKLVVKKEIKKSKYFLILLSNHSLNKAGYVQKELRIAIDSLDELPPNAIFIIPVRIEECKPYDEKLLALNWTDIFPSYESGLEKILRVIAPEKLGGSTHSDIEDYFSIRRISYEEMRRLLEPQFVLADVELNENVLENIYAFSMGNPVVAILGVDYLIRSSDEGFLNIISKNKLKNLSGAKFNELRIKFESAIVSPFFDHKSTLDLVILNLCAIKEPVTVELCSYLFNKSFVETRGLLEQLKNFFFVKYDGVNNTYFIHDTVSYLLNTHGWILLDPLGGTRRGIREKAARYYEKRISGLLHKMAHLQNRFKIINEQRDFDKQSQIISALEKITYELSYANQMKGKLITTE